MSELGGRIAELFTEIAPAVDLERIPETVPVPDPVRSSGRRGWLVAVAAAVVVLVGGVSSFLVFGGSDDPGVSTDGTAEVSSSVAPEVATTQGDGSSTTVVDSVTSVPDDSFVPEVLVPVRVECSSELPAFPCAALVDGYATTRWNAAEGGVGAAIHFTFDPPIQIVSIDLVNAPQPEAFARNARIRGLEALADDVADVTVLVLEDIGTNSVTVASGFTTRLTLRVTAAYPAQSFEGSEPFAELALAEVRVWGRPSPLLAPTDVPQPSSSGLVSPPQWPSPVLGPVLALPDCEDGSARLAAFIEAEFPETTGDTYRSMPAVEIGEITPMPRIGDLSLFQSGDLDGACLETGAIHPAYGWLLADRDGETIAIGATAAELQQSIPDGVIGEYYHQSWIATGHGFSVSVDPDGRLWGAVDRAYTVLEAPGLFDGLDEDPYLLGERLAASLAKTPLRTAMMTEVGPDTPTGLPPGYGPCLISPLFVSQAPEYTDLTGNSELVLGGFCNRDGDYLLIHRLMYGAGPMPAAGAEPIPVGRLDGTAWTEDGRGVVVVNEGRLGGGAMWITGPGALAHRTLAEVLASTVLLQDGVIEPRHGDGDLRGELSGDWLHGVLAVAGADRIEIGNSVEYLDAQFQIDDDIAGSVIVFPHVDQNDFQFALMLPVTGTEPIGPVDVLIRDSGNRIQAVLTCGQVTFNNLFEATYPNPESDWSHHFTRYPRAVVFLAGLVDRVCASTPEPSVTVPGTTP